MLNCCCFAERVGGERECWCQFVYLHEDPSPHVCRYSFSKNNVSHACILEQLVELDVEAPVCFTVVERQEVFTQLPALLHLIVDTFLIIIFIEGCRSCVPVFLNFINVLLPLVLCLVDFSCLFAHFAIPIHCFDELT